MPSMKITLSAAMRARDASRPHAEHETAAREADEAGPAQARPAGRQRPAAGGGKPPRDGEPGGQPASRPEQASGRRGGGQRSGRGRGRSRRRQGK